MRERLALAVECYDAGDTTSKLNTINSWVQMVREGFDLMPADGEEAAANVTRRMAAVPRAYVGESNYLRIEIAFESVKPSGINAACGYGCYGRAWRLPQPRADAAGQGEGCLRA